MIEPYAVLNGSIVINVIIWDSSVAYPNTDGTTLEPTGGQPVNIGDTWNGSTFVTTADQGAPVASTIFDTAGFKMLFTEAERIAIRAAAQSNGTVEDFWDLVMSSSVIDLTDPFITAGIANLVTAAMLTQGRATAILAGQQSA